MLPTQHRLHRPSDFTSVVRGGRRVGRRHLVLHIRRTAEADAPLARQGGPRVGLVVSKAVGDAVTRHLVSRRLRHAAADLLPHLPEDLDLVIRALPRSATATSAELAGDLASALRKAGIDPAAGPGDR
ncbi:ribonuclease P protein component [Corynebacterium sp. 335C]